MAPSPLSRNKDSAEWVPWFLTSHGPHIFQLDAIHGISGPEDDKREQQQERYF